MSNVHEVLADVKAARLCREAVAEPWQQIEREAELIKQCKMTSHPKLAVWSVWAFGVLALCAVAVVFFKRAELLMPLGTLIIPVFGFLSLVVSAIDGQLRRDAALLELIKQQAPELHAKLKDEHVL